MATKKVMDTPAEDLEEKDPREMTPEESKKYWAELVPFRAFKDSGKYHDDIVVGINGRIWQVQRGKQVMIPRNVREVILESMAQDEATAELIDRETTKFAEESKIYG